MGPVPLVVVPCGGRKLDRATTAGDLYTGSYHAACRRYAAAVSDDDHTLILSARYGLLRLDDPVIPYELTFGQPGAVTADVVAAQAARYGLSGHRPVIVAAGRRYADVACAVWPDAVRLLDGTRGIGEQLARLRDAARAAACDVVAGGACRCGAATPRPGGPGSAGPPSRSRR